MSQLLACFLYFFLLRSPSLHVRNHWAIALILFYTDLPFTMSAYQLSGEDDDETLILSRSYDDSEYSTMSLYNYCVYTGPNPDFTLPLSLSAISTSVLTAIMAFMQQRMQWMRKKNELRGKNLFIRLSSRCSWQGTTKEYTNSKDISFFIVSPLIYYCLRTTPVPVSIKHMCDP